MNVDPEPTSAWALIPARAGSKGVPGKNLRAVAGKPLLGWTIEAALAAEAIDRVIVSTDDDRISEVAMRFGAEVVRRPAALSGDSASSESALIHALGALAKAEDLPALTVFLQCTSPLTTADDIDGTVEALIERGADSAFAASRFHYFLWKEDESGAASGTNHAASVRLPRQEREPEYIEAGAVYVMRTEGFLEARHRFFGRTVIHEIPLARRCEIDDPADLQLADLILRERLAGSDGEE